MILKAGPQKVQKLTTLWFPEYLNQPSINPLGRPLNSFPKKSNHQKTTTKKTKQPKDTDMRDYTKASSKIYSYSEFPMAFLMAHSFPHE